MVTVRFAGLPIRQATVETIVREILESPRTAPQTFRLVNAGTIYEARRDPEYWQLLLDGGNNLPDGAPLAHFVRTRSRRGQAEHIRGPSLFEACMSAGREYGTRHYLLGSSEQTLKILGANLSLRYPGVHIVGVESPPYKALDQVELAAQDQRIMGTRPDIVWVALGTPKQDAEARRISDALNLTTVAVGAAFDFSAGRIAEAPPMIRQLRLEWLFRLVTEPRRLWRRYFFGNSVFIGLWAREVLRPRS